MKSIIELVLSNIVILVTVASLFNLDSARNSDSNCSCLSFCQFVVAFFYHMFRVLWHMNKYICHYQWVITSMCSRTWWGWLGILNWALLWMWARMVIYPCVSPLMDWKPFQGPLCLMLSVSPMSVWSTQRVKLITRWVYSLFCKI